jgi:acyl-coenzyme A synthetase/AMP-(fatty) acid ligase
MPKGLDPKAVAARITAAKKKVASMDPATKQRLKEMYPPVDTKKIIGGGLTSKTINAVRAKKAAPKQTLASSAKKDIKFMKEKATPKAKPKTLNDFLKEGKRPPIKNKKIPSDADVIIKGYNDKKTLFKNKKK